MQTLSLFAVLPLFLALWARAGKADFVAFVTTVGFVRVRVLSGLPALFDRCLRN